VTQATTTSWNFKPQPLRADVYLLGAGLTFPEHLTIQTVEVLSACTHICTILPEARLNGLPQNIKDKCTSLWPLYQEGRVRTENYQDVTDAVIKAVEVSAPIAWLTPGHPIVFDSVSAALLREGKTRGWRVCVVPAISCIDTLLAELGYDPAYGLLILEATSLVRQSIPILPSIATILIQPSVFDIDVASMSSNHSGPDLSPLRDYLSRYYSLDHACAFVRTTSWAGARDEVTWLKLSELPSVPYPVLAGSSLFLPAALSQEARPA
jgi:hypothetical protein